MKKPRRVLPVALASAAAFVSIGMMAPTAQAALHPGPTTVHPSQGGTWQYGFWNVKVRSYYNTNRCHGSSVRLNGSLARSIDTAAGHTSIAEKYAVNTPGADDSYYFRNC
jgi:hypothetical protein